jgi:ribosomal protein S18 acetylase RimI-like enzyme
VQTADFDVARTWAEELYGSPHFLDFWFPRHHFIGAERGNDWMSATRTDKDKSYGMAIGAGAQPNPEWNHFSYSSSADQSLIETDTYKHDGGWIAYVIKTSKYSDVEPLEVVTTSDKWPEIDAFLEKHFSDASVKADNPEVLAWTVLRNNECAIIAAGALSQWESGALAANSIGVDSSLRGQGIGKKFVTAMVANAAALGFDSLCLGVYNKNIAGIKTYESVGFTKIDEFFHYTEIDDTVKRRNRPVRD